MSEAIVPFTIAIDQSDLTDLQSRLSRTRLPDSIAGSGWDYGIDIDYLRNLLDYWKKEYNWRAAEARLNEFEHFRTRIQDHLVHFVHVRSLHRQATPLLMVHGWPGSIVEFLGVIDRLVAPEHYGGDPRDAFHLVMPSLPGYAFSEAPRVKGWGPNRIAQVFTELMARLGYESYGVQGGDWGAIVVREMALADSGHIIGLHTNMPVACPPQISSPLTLQEESDVAAVQSFAETEQAYVEVQRTKPQTLGIGLNDSPAGLCAWIAEKFCRWADWNETPDSEITRDSLLTNIMLYWLSGTAASAARIYYEYSCDKPTWSKGKVLIPTGVAMFPKELRRWPRAWVEMTYNLVRWTRMPRGGHFAALEQPALFADDVLAFFRELRQSAQ